MVRERLWQSAADMTSGESGGRGLADEPILRAHGQLCFGVAHTLPHPRRLLNRLFGGSAWFSLRCNIHAFAGSIRHPVNAQERACGDGCPSSVQVTIRRVHENRPPAMRFAKLAKILAERPVTTCVALSPEEVKTGATALFLETESLCKRH